MEWVESGSRTSRPRSPRQTQQGSAYTRPKMRDRILDRQRRLDLAGIISIPSSQPSPRTEVRDIGEGSDTLTSPHTQEPIAQVTPLPTRTSLPRSVPDKLRRLVNLLSVSTGNFSYWHAHITERQQSVCRRRPLPGTITPNAGPAIRAQDHPCLASI